MSVHHVTINLKLSEVLILEIASANFLVTNEKIFGVWI